MTRCTLTVLAAALAMLPAGAAYAQDQQQEPEIGEASTVCSHPFASGAGEKRLAWCVSDTANLVQFESPAGREHIRVGTILEGYVVCTGGIPFKWDSAEAGAGWNPGAVIDTSPLTIRRISTDGLYLLDTSFKQDKVERDITVTMALTNRTGAAIADIAISRYVDFDIDGSTSNRFDRNVDSSWGYAPLTGHGMVLAPLNPEIAHLTAVEPFSSLVGGTKSACLPFQAALPANGDFSSRVTYLIGGLNPGQKKTVKFLYRRQ